MTLHLHPDLPGFVYEYEGELLDLEEFDFQEWPLQIEVSRTGIVRNTAGTIIGFLPERIYGTAS